MSRDLTSEFTDELSAPTIRPLFLFEGIFAETTLRLWDGFGTLTWDSKEWLGNGWYQGIDDVSESGEVQAQNLDVRLSGVPLALVSLLLTESRHSGTGRVWMGLFDESEQVIDDACLLFSGMLSAPRIDDSSNGSEIILTYENDLVMLQRASELRTNDAAQQSIFPGDRGFQFAVGLEEWSGFFGNKEKPVAEKKTKTTKNKGSRK